MKDERKMEEGEDEWKMMIIVLLEALRDLVLYFYWLIQEELTLFDFDLLLQSKLFKVIQMVLKQIIASLGDIYEEY